MSHDVKLQDRLSRRTDELTAFYLLAVAVRELYTLVTKLPPTCGGSLAC